MAFTVMIYAVSAASFFVGYMACVAIHHRHIQSVAKFEQRLKERERKLAIAGDIVGGMVAAAKRGVEFNGAHVINLLERVRGILRG